MKRIVSLFLSLTMLFSLSVGIDLSAYALDSEGSCGDNLTYIFDEFSNTLIINGSGDMYNYDLTDNQSPFYPLTENDIIKTVEISYGVTSIGSYAFNSCTELTNVILPDSLTSIGEYAFSNCINLTDIVIPEGVSSIGSCSFMYTNLTDIALPDSVLDIGSYAFSSSGLSNVEIPEYVMSIGENAFDCDTLANINVDENNQCFSSKDGVLFNKNKSELICFPRSNSISNYITPNTLVSIPSYAFSNCNNLKSVTISESVLSIGKGAFENCRGLESIMISDSVSDIGPYAFNYCTALTDIELPDSITSIGECAFRYCINLINVKLPNNISSIESSVFSDCKKIEKLIIPDGVTTIGDSAFFGCSSLTEINIPDSVVSLGNFAFRDCKGLTSIKISKNVSYISNTAFYNCKGLDEFVVDENNLCYSSENGLLFDKEKSILIQYPIAKQETKYILPDSVNAISDYAFQYANLSEIVLNDNIVRIGAYAFSNSKLTNVEIPENVMFIGDCAFNCATLTEINVDENNKNFSSENGILFNKDKTKLIRYSIANDRNSYIVPDSVVTIEKYAFNGSSNLTSVVLGSNVNSICEGAFYFCKNLNKVLIDVGVNSIGYNAFMGCWNLKNVYYMGSREQWRKIKVDMTAFSSPTINYNHTHTAVIDASVEPTCSENGLTEGSHCSECNAVIVKQNVVYAKGHLLSYDSVNIYKHKVICGNCDYTDEEEHSFINGICEKCGFVKIDETAFIAALTELESELEKTDIYTSESIVKVKSILDSIKSSKENCKNQEELNGLVTKLISAKSELVLSGYTIVFVIDNDGEIIKSENKYQYGEIAHFDAKTDKVLKWTVEAQNGVTNLGITNQTYDYVVTRNAIVTVYTTSGVSDATEFYSKITFVGHHNSIVAVKYVKDGETIETSSVSIPDISFYNKKGWNVASVTGVAGKDFQVKAAYVASGTEKCCVCFNGFSKEYDYDSFVYLADANENERYAMYDENDNLLTYFIGKSFYAPHTDKVIIKKAVDDNATSAITGYYKKDTKLIYNVKFYLPENTTLIKAGMEITVGDVTATFYADRVSEDNEYSYAIDFNSLTGVEVRARSFVEYKTADGLSHVIYSSEVLQNI